MKFMLILTASRILLKKDRMNTTTGFSRLWVGFLSVTVVLAFAACDRLQESGRNSTFANINTKKVLKAGYIVFPPCVFKDPKTGKLGGHFVATIHEIAKQAGWEVEFQEADWSTFTAGLNTKRFDVSIAPTFVTVPRAMTVSFTKPLFYAGNSAIVRATESRFTDVGSLDQPNIKIAVTQGEAGHEYARSNFKHAEIIPHPGSDQTLTMQDVLSGRADVALGDAYVTARFAAEHADAVKDLFAGRPYNLTPVSWAVRSTDSELLAFLNACIETLETQGKLLQFELAADAHWSHPKREWEVK